MAEPKDSCVKPAEGPMSGSAGKKPQGVPTQQEEPKMIARVGKPAPDFEASAFVGGGFKNIKLSDYSGKMGGPLLLSWGFHLCLTD